MLQCATAGLIFSAAVFTGCLTMDWVSTAPGVEHYPHHRYWNMFRIKGKKEQTYSQIYKDMCLRGQAKFVAGMCISPLCKYYFYGKCKGYEIIFYGSLIGILCTVLGVTLQCVGTSCLCSSNSRSVSMGFLIGLLGVVLNIVAGPLFLMMVKSGIDYINVYGIYPFPAPDMGFIAWLVAVMAVVPSAICACCYNTAVQWEAKEAESDEGSEESD
ncbi:unnamed protein product [Vitrella brassicaformis CCMP3155]|uniref:Uncharacterized protein n=2 Tax=Vitrella brassicaformis TaxID=1169539 RepID=A0A0G4EIU4_VITBC|nr:unnamed protein product [Vitrella brassicaformis CCMP3155]|eukprot:CEL96614.1 unnamed protein product [Vitrella brassicaformis CCMP3155]